VLYRSNVQCVHKVPSGFWKIVARKQIELATCRLRQITEKLWKFFLLPTDGISGHLYVSQSVVCEMATVQERARCVGWLFETKSVTQTQRNYRTQLNKQPLSDNAIRDWQRRFVETGSVHYRKRSGRPGVSDECMERIRESFVRSPTKSTRRRRASRELLLPRTIWWHTVLYEISVYLNFYAVTSPNAISHCLSPGGLFLFGGHIPFPVNFGYKMKQDLTLINYTEYFHEPSYFLHPT
jgi:transposase